MRLRGSSCAVLSGLDTGIMNEYVVCLVGGTVVVEVLRWYLVVVGVEVELCSIEVVFEAYSLGSGLPWFAYEAYGLGASVVGRTSGAVLVIGVVEDLYHQQLSRSSHCVSLCSLGMLLEEGVGLPYQWSVQQVTADRNRRNTQQEEDDEDGEGKMGVTIREEKRDGAGGGKELV
ncbi:hypothetical protein Taro_001004 [Colocasia esculenta]|uniref:Uncharacterized protein n=1 Tax=Colocasia esculenta TaxID=4460 RepID=A0A843TJC9_COLES|nr:hypothetical protein [Colocasia esculenta]